MNDATIEAFAVVLTLINWVNILRKDAIESGRIARRWWKAHGRIYATMAGITALLLFCGLCAGLRLAWGGLTWFTEALSLDGDGPVWGQVPNWDRDFDAELGHALYLWSFMELRRA